MAWAGSFLVFFGGLPAALSLAFSVAAATAHCLTLGLSSFDSDLAFTDPNKRKITYSGKRAVLLLPQVPMAFVKSLKNAASASPHVEATKVTVNDVLSALLAGAVRRYCASQGELDLKDTQDFPEVQTRALIPVAFPRAAAATKKEKNARSLTAPFDDDDDGDGGSKNDAIRNLWCMLSCGLPVGVASPLRRIAAVQKSTYYLKRSPRAVVQLFIQNTVLPWLPASLSQQTCVDIFSRHSCVFTNVPGPDEAILFAGIQVTGIQMVFPNLLSQVSMLSYDGNLISNCVVDPQVVKHPSQLRKGFVDELAAMATALEVPLPEGGLVSRAEEKRLAAIDAKLGIC